MVAPRRRIRRSPLANVGVLSSALIVVGAVAFEAAGPASPVVGARPPAAGLAAGDSSLPALGTMPMRFVDRSRDPAPPSAAREPVADAVAKEQAPAPPVTVFLDGEGPIGVRESRPLDGSHRHHAGTSDDLAVGSRARGARPAGATAAQAAPPAVYLPLALAAGAPVSGASPAASDDWCQRLIAGPAGRADAVLDLSAAHATVRQFSVESVYGPGDRALAAALALTDALRATGIANALARYDAALGDVCVLPAATGATAGGALAPTKIDVVDGVAFVVPGAGDVEVPAGARAVALDLRGLPAVDGLDAAIGRAVAASLGGDVERPAWRVRWHRGPTDEMFSATNVYTTGVMLDRLAPLTETAATDRRLAVLTGERLAPVAARWAGALRLAGRASIVGEGVVAAVAEADWRGVGGYGLAVRTRLANRVFRRRPLDVRRAQPIAQDDPDVVASAGWKVDVDLPDDLPSVLTVTIDGRDVDDLDLFVLRDVDGDGQFVDPDERVAASAGSTADEMVTLVDAPGGRYQVWVLGYEVAGGVATFDATIDVEASLIWPDVIRADRHLSAAVANDRGAIADIVSSLPEVPAAAIGATTRTRPERVHPFNQRHPVATARGELRAALIIAHGMTRMYFRYFDDVGDGIDARLAETLATLDGMPVLERPAAARLLRRFGQVLHDGHQFNRDYGAAPAAGYLPVFIDPIANLPVVRRSGIDSLRPGDTILSIDGRSTADWYAEEMSRTSAASPGYLFDMTSRFFTTMVTTHTYGVRDPDGVERTAIVPPQPPERSTSVVWPPSLRPSGTLADLGAPDLAYLNLDGEAIEGTVAVRHAISDAVAAGSEGLVLDMRGYPSGINHYEVARRLIPAPFLSPRFVYTVFSGPDRHDIVTSQSTWTPLTDPSYSGPIVLLTGEHAVSAAENFMLMLVGANRLTAIVGQPSAATNGNVTGLQLPGGFAFGYTGMGLLYPDGSRFHGIGIRPTIEVPLSARDFRDGIDRELLTAIEVLQRRRAP